MEELGRLTNRRLRRFFKEFKELIDDYPKLGGEVREVDWSRYEAEYDERLRYVGRELNILARAAIGLMEFNRSNPGRPPKLSLQQKVVALLLKGIFSKTNRPMAGLLGLFSAFCGIDVSYKTVERLYSDELVEMALRNIFTLTVKRRCGGRRVEVTGDGTGYSLTLTKHYRAEVDKEGKRKYVYSFNLMDLGSKLYIAYGSGVRSERQAFERAVCMLRKVEEAAGIRVAGARLDRAYSYQSTLKYLDDETVLYITPKSNTTVNGPARWRDTLRRMMKDPFSYLVEYYKRENSESGFSADKRLVGWKIWQRRDDRINTAISCIATIHNIFRMSYQ